MRRPHDRVAWAWGAALVAVLLLIGALMAHGPLPPSGRVVSVDEHGQITD